MSNKFRNPFKLRNSEKIESEGRFLRLFSPLVLDALNTKYTEGHLWENVLLIHSSPGGGKTSLLRIFEPATLNTLLNNKSAPDYRKLFNSLKKIEVIDNSKVEVLGVPLPCTRNYQILEELDISEAQKKRLFFSMLNSRIILSTLRSACKLKNVKFPEGLKEFDFNYHNKENYFKTIGVPCSAEKLYHWASTLEKNIYTALDSFVPSLDVIMEGHDELISLLSLRPETLLHRGKSFCSKILFMFDDAHKLSDTQRLMFKQYIFEKRSDVNVWISERLEALGAEDQLGSFEGRDFEVLNLENFWKRNPGKLGKILRSISDKRAAISTEEVTSFQEYLSEHLNEEDIKEKLDASIKEAWQNISKISKFTNRFDLWTEYFEQYGEDTQLKQVLALKEVEILIHRSMGRPQLSLEFPFSIDELHKKKSGDVQNAARLFLSAQSEIPYYYSFDTLAKLSSNNIEQFLSFGSELFEEMISNKIKGDEITLSDKTQHSIINRVASNNWKKLPTEIPYARIVRKFLEGFGEYARKQTFKPNAPYSPGVNGFAIRLSNQAKLYKEEIWLDNPIYEPLVNVISTCVANNLLEKHTSVHQGQKGQTWTVYYLNRWLCVHFGLPLSYGGWRHQTPDQLIQWIKK